MPATNEKLTQEALRLGKQAKMAARQLAPLASADKNRALLLMADKLEALRALPLPQSFRETADRLKGRFLSPSVVWWRQARK